MIENDLNSIFNKIDKCTHIIIIENIIIKIHGKCNKSILPECDSFIGFKKDNYIFDYNKYNKTLTLSYNVWSNIIKIKNSNSYLNMISVLEKIVQKKFSNIKIKGCYLSGWSKNY